VRVVVAHANEAAEHLVLLGHVPAQQAAMQQHQQVNSTATHHRDMTSFARPQDDAGMMPESKAKKSKQSAGAVVQYHKPHVFS
jgi:hypothetical protein